MTGFGAAQAQAEGVDFAIEVRSLNNRYFKASLRLPEELARLEGEIEAKLRKRLGRGSVALLIRLKYAAKLSAHRVNDDALVAYLDHLESLHKRFSSREQAITIDLTALLALPGVLQPTFDQDSFIAKANPVVLKLVDEACDRLSEMRVTEGGTIADELNCHVKEIRDRLNMIKARAAHVVDEYHQRLRSRVDELIARAELKVGEVDLVRELAIFAERADISEEVSRLGAHLDQIDRVTQQTDGEPAGRVLDFLSQELLREANTIASKSNDAEISRAIVEVKGAIDRIKEQVQNVE